jgi:hypothetical protein
MEEITDLEKLIITTLNERSKLIFGSSLNVKLFKISFERIETELNSFENGLTVSSYSFTDTPGVIFLYNLEFLDKYKKNYAEFVKKEEHEITVLPVAKSLSLPFSKLIYFSGDTSQNERIEKNEALIDSYHNSSFFSDYNKKSKEELLWRSADSIIYRVETETDKFYIFFKENNYYYLEKYLEEGKYTIQSLAKKIYNVLKKENVLLSRLEIRTPNELLLNRFILPSKITCSAFEIFPNYLFFRTPLKSDLATERYRYGFELSISGKNYPIYFALPKKGDDQLEFKKQMDGIVSCICKLLLQKYAELNIRIDKKAAGPVDTFQLNNTICMTSELYYGKSKVPCEIFISRNIMELLYEKLGDKDENPNYFNKAQGELLNFIYLNRNLLKKNISNFYKYGTEGFLEAGSPVLFYQFINLLSENDIKVVVQNFFISQGWKTKDIKNLFYCWIPGANKKDKTIVLFSDFREEKILKNLPDRIKDEWSPMPIRPEFAIQLIPTSLDKESFISKNLEVMKSIFELYKKGKLELSAKGVIVLKKDFASVLDAKLIAKLEEFNKSNIDTLDLIVNVGKSALQKYFYEWSHMDMAMVLYGWESKVELFKPHVSKNYMQSVIEQQTVISVKLAENDIDLEKIYLLKESFINYIKGMNDEAVIG